MSPKISVIIPTFNVEKYIGQCMDTVLGQTLQEIEVICVDDGSEDSTLEILKAYAKKDGRMKVIKQENINAGAARNRGLKYATGKYVVFLDADDFFEKKMLEKMWERAEKVQAEVVVAGSDVFDDDKQIYTEGRAFEREMIPRAEVFAGRDVDKLFLVFVGWPWDKMFLKEFLDENRLKFQEQRSTNDLYFVYAALAKARKVSVVDEVLAHHRVNVRTSISMTREKSWGCAFEAILKLKKQLVEWKMFDEAMQRSFVNYALHHLLWHLETLRKPAQEKFYNALREKWVLACGLVDEKDYYFDENEFEKLVCIKNNSYVDYLYDTVMKLRAGCATEWNRAERLAKELETAKKENEELRAQNQNLENGLKEICDSRAYKIGLATTSLPRKMGLARQKKRS